MFVLLSRASSRNPGHSLSLSSHLEFPFLLRNAGFENSLRENPTMADVCPDFHDRQFGGFFGIAVTYEMKRILEVRDKRQPVGVSVPRWSYAGSRGGGILKGDRAGCQLWVRARFNREMMVRRGSWLELGDGEGGG